MRRVDVARDDREQIDILLRYRLRNARLIADGDFIERSILDHLPGRGRWIEIHTWPRSHFPHIGARRVADRRIAAIRRAKAGRRHRLT